ncbi:MAG: hypothetical protein F9K23_13420 [Bacteroidetes bacterium]|nr:MAG: hypothetical protein F9K23_13420 [Bacteroidota bacterium]
MLTAEILGLKYHRVLANSVTPEFTASLKADYDYSFVISYGGFEDPEYNTIDKNAGIIDLTKGLDHVFANFNKKNRQHVRGTETTEELSFTHAIDDFDSYFQFYKRCENERGWYPVPESELKNSIVFSAAFNGHFIAGVTAYTTGNKLRLGRIYSTKRSNDQTEISNALSGASTKRIIFEFCKYGIENGFATLDLGGVDLNDPSKAGITQFKQSFGIEIIPVKIGRYTSQTFNEKEHLIRENGYDLT